MSDKKMNNSIEPEKENDVNIEEIDEAPVFTLTDTDTGEEKDFELIASAEIDEVLYYALVPADEESEEYAILRVTEDGDDLVLESIDDDDEFEKVEDYFNHLLFNEVDYDND
jgi:hypothetical protein